MGLGQGCWGLAEKENSGWSEMGRSGIQVRTVDKHVDYNCCHPRISKLHLWQRSTLSSKSKEHRNAGESDYLFTCLLLKFLKVQGALCVWPPRQKQCGWIWEPKKAHGGRINSLGDKTTHKKGWNSNRSWYFHPRRSIVKGEHEKKKTQEFGSIQLHLKVKCLNSVNSPT